MSRKILASILSADMLSLGEEIESVLNAGVDMIHLDIMDNHYVPNLTIGSNICHQIRQRFPKSILDVHLMTTPVDALIHDFAKAGASRISIHPDATIHLDRSLALIQSHNIQAGLVLNPATPIDCLKWCIDRLSFVLVMTVNPGFGGQTFIETQREKIRDIKKHYPELTICVDGGVNLDNIAALTDDGVTEFVTGSTLFHAKDYGKMVKQLKH